MPKAKPRYSEPTDLADLVSKKVADLPVSDVSVDELIGDGLSALYREVKNILVMTTKGKLDPNNARDLRDHLKLLFELKDRELDRVKSLSPEQLKYLIEQAEEKQTSDSQ